MAGTARFVVNVFICPLIIARAPTITGNLVVLRCHIFSNTISRALYLLSSFYSLIFYYLLVLLYLFEGMFFFYST